MFDDIVYKVWDDEQKEFAGQAKIGKKMQYTG